MYQKSDIDFAGVYLLLEATIGTIRELKTSKSGNTLKKFLSLSPSSPTVDDDGLTPGLTSLQFVPHTIQDTHQQLVTPVSTVDCESGFSRQNLIKTAIRNRINLQNLGNLMTISTEEPDNRKDFNSPEHSTEGYQV